MASGNKRLVINSKERALSTDINRLQSFGGWTLAETLRYAHNVRGNDDLEAGVIAEPSSLESPLSGEIQNGLMVRPQAASTDLFVDPGVCFLLVPDASADDSNYKIVRDLGVQTTGVLQVAANPSGSIRIDVIEAQFGGDVVTAYDNRDIYDTTNGTFSALSVPKVTQGRLTYRVRQGTPGSGYPGAASGWLALAVASVPAGCTNNNAVTFWDVRPLINDRVFPYGNITKAYPSIERANYTIQSAVGGELVINGNVEATLGAQRVGGILRRGTPGTDGDSIDLKAVENQSPGFSFLQGSNGDVYIAYYLYLAQPFGLSRWARYTDGPSGRVPRSPRGIPIVTNVAPQHLTGLASAPISLPTSTGLGGTTTNAIAVAAGGAKNVAGTPLVAGGTADGRTFWSKYVDNSPPDGLLQNAGFKVGENTTGLFTLTGTNYPPNAKAIHVQVRVTYTLPAGSAHMAKAACLRIRKPSTSNDECIVHASGAGFTSANTDASNHGVELKFLFRVPIHVSYPSTIGSALDVLFDWSNDVIDGSGPVSSPSIALFIGAWDL